MEFVDCIPDDEEAAGFKNVVLVPDEMVGTLRTVMFHPLDID